MVSNHSAVMTRSEVTVHIKAQCYCARTIVGTATLFLLIWWFQMSNQKRKLKKRVKSRPLTLSLNDVP